MSIEFCHLCGLRPITRDIMCDECYANTPEAKDATIADLAAKLKRAVEVVKLVEWSLPIHAYGACCPACEDLEHTPTCPLAAVIKENA